MWIELTALFALVIAAMGGLALVQPNRLFRLIESIDIPRHLWPIAIARLFFGGCLWMAAPESAQPTVLRSLALLVIAAGVALPVIGPERIQRLVEWWQQRASGVIRAWGILVIALGLYLLWAISA